MRLTGLSAGLLLAVGSLSRAEAQTETRPTAAVELTVGAAAFIDEAPIGHSLVGVAMRAHLTPRLSFGPELVYMRGPGADRDVFLTGNLTFDLRGPDNGQPKRVTPYLVIGGGFSRFSNNFGGRDFSSYEFALTGGGGVRVWVTPRVYVAGEYRLGWEAHARMTGTVGFALSPRKST